MISILNNLEELADEQTYKRIQKIIGSSENQNEAVPALQERKKVPQGYKNYNDYFQEQLKQGQRNRVALRRAYIEEIRLERSVTVGTIRSSEKHF